MAGSTGTRTGVWLGMEGQNSSSILVRFNGRSARVATISAVHSLPILSIVLDAARVNVRRLFVGSSSMVLKTSSKYTWRTEVVFPRWHLWMIPPTHLTVRSTSFRFWCTSLLHPQIWKATLKRSLGKTFHVILSHQRHTY